MGRAEAFAANNPLGLTVADSLGVGAGYTFALLVISFFRELIGFGSIFGRNVLPDGLEPVQLMAIPPGAFFALGVAILIVNLIRRRHAAPTEKQKGCGSCASC
jgi:Na+-transporting NADH:ubiquinone oxidoreductase subunit NqrD